MFFPENGASERKTPPLMKTRAPRARPSDGRFRVLDRMVFEKIGKTGGALGLRPQLGNPEWYRFACRGVGSAGNERRLFTRQGLVRLVRYGHAKSYLMTVYGRTFN